MAVRSSNVSVGIGVIVEAGGTGINVKVGTYVSVGTTLTAGAQETKI
jgi:hypothetical protein